MSPIADAASGARFHRECFSSLRLLASFVLIFATAVCLSACGSSGNSGASELARQRELAAARNQAAQDASQSAHIQQLERQVKEIHSGGGEAAVPRSEPSTPSAPVAQGDWPGGSGYTAILTSDSSQSQARSDQAQATGRGLDAGVLNSSEFSSLRPGYWVVFSGTFSTQPDASRRAARAKELGFQDAYPRFVAP